MKSVLVVSQSHLDVWKEHIRLWHACADCELSKTRNKVIFLRGHLPCDILFIGEGPGKTEDALGVPFIGLAGKLLDKLVEPFAHHHRMAVGNVVGCRPCDSKGGSNRTPTDKELDRCHSKICSEIDLASPVLVVSLGHTSLLSIANSIGKAEIFHLPHPAYLLRCGGAASDAFYATQEKLTRKIGELTACGILNATE